jgi:hypothetical protein
MRLALIFLSVTVALGGTAAAQDSRADFAPLGVVNGVHSFLPAIPETRGTTARLAPELALQTYENNAERQLSQLGYSSDVTVVEAALPGTGQKGRFELHRSFMAPKSLAYGAIKFVGDNFVKTNIILKLLTSEVDHVEKGEGPATAITPENYKFAYKGTQTLNGRDVYEFRVKPRKKRSGLFKGKVLLDVATGQILRAEGTLVKSPSVFVKRVEFVQEYQQVDGFSLPVRTHSVAKTRLFGEAVVDISHSDYSAAPLAQSTGGDNAGAAGTQQ